MPTPRHAVTGAFGYSGRQIAKRLLARGHEIITLTNKPPQPGPITTFPLNFADPDSLARALDGVEVLYNTYWVRFNHGNFSHADGQSADLLRPSNRRNFITRVSPRESGDGRKNLRE